MYTPEPGESEPDWVQTERKQFSEYRDTNKVKMIFVSSFLNVRLRHCFSSLHLLLCCVFVVQDGYLDAAEVALWVLPGEVDHADNEAKHLIHETDTDKVNLSLLGHMCLKAIGKLHRWFCFYRLWLQWTVLIFGCLKHTLEYFDAYLYQA